MTRSTMRMRNVKTAGAALALLTAAGALAALATATPRWSRPTQDRSIEASSPQQSPLGR